MKLLRLGKDGQVGSALQQALPALGEMVALGRAEADFERPGELARLIATHAPDVIVNAAAYTAVDRAEADADRARLVNAEAVAILAAAAQRSGAWLVHYSTDYVYDGRKPEPYLEADEARPLSVYGSTKLRGDSAIAASGCRHVIFRVSWVYAAGHPNFGATMLRLAKDRDSLDVVDDQVGAPTSARLIAATTAKVLATAGERQDISGVYHLAATGTVSRNGYARFVVAEALAHGAALTLRPEAIRPIASTALPTPAERPLNSRLDTTRLQQAFAIALPAWEEDARAWVTESLAGSAA